MDERLSQAEEVEALQKDWKPHGPELDASGAICGEQPAEAPSVGLAPAAHVEGLRPLAEVQTIEFARAAPPTRTDFAAAAELGSGLPFDVCPKQTEGPGRGTRAGRSLKWSALALLIGAAVWKGDEIRSLLWRRILPSSWQSSRTPILSIQSEPPGARIQIGSRSLGETPLFMENLYPRTQIEVRLSLKGYQPWTGRFTGGEPVEVKARLRRR